MADISKEIQDFRDAVYGEEVRGSMISLAEKVNKESTDAKTAAAKSASDAGSAASNASYAVTQANQAAQNANTAAQNIQTKADRGDFTGTIQIGEVTTGEPGSQASVNNSGTAKDAVLDIKIPSGYQGVSMRMAGVWTVGTAYVNNSSYIDLVTYDGGSYACKTTHTASEEITPTNEEYWQCIAKQGRTGGMENIDTTPITFEEVAERENLESGEPLPTSLGKIKKWFSDLKQAAFMNVVNGVTQSVAGQAVLDAAVGKYLDEKKFDISKIIANRNITEPGFAMDGKTAVDWFNELTGNMGNGNNASLSTSILDKALEFEERGIQIYRLGGSNYTGGDLPSIDYANGTALILKRSASTITVILTGSRDITPLAINYFYGDTWIGWQKYVRTSDLGYIVREVDTDANKSVSIPDAPPLSGFFPIIAGHYSTNNVIENVFYDAGTWRVCSNVSQKIVVRFYKYPI